MIPIAWDSHGSPGNISHKSGEHQIFASEIMALV